LGNPNLNSAALQAGLNNKQRDQVDGLSKLLDSHRKLLALPQGQAQQAFNSQTEDQKKAQVNLFGGDDGPVGWLGNAAHYVTEGFKQTIGRGLGALNEVSDLMTRLYRTGAIAADQDVDLYKAFQIANDKGDKVFSPSRIEAAQAKFGKDMTSVAMKIASGTTLDAILATGTDAEKQIAAKAAQLQENKKKDLLLQDAIDAVQAAKYSPGRAVANALLPESMEGSGFLYKGISGAFDASYRIFVDPTLLLGKAKKSYDAANYALFKIVGEGKVDDVFSKVNLLTGRNGVADFFDTYGAQLDKLAKAREVNDLKAATEAATQLKRLAPEFGTSAIDEFIKAGVKNADTAKNYLKNQVDLNTILSGQGARKTPLIPRLDARRKTRVALLTGANKVFDIDKVGQKLVDGLYGTRFQTDDILTGLTDNVEGIAKVESKVGKLKQDGGYRLSLNQIGGRIDRFAQKFATIPYFKDGFFDVTSKNAEEQVYRLARLSNTRYHSKVIAQAFAAGDEGQKKAIFTGLWNTIAEIRGVSKNAAGQTYMSEFAGKGLQKQYAGTMARLADDGTALPDYNPASIEGEQMALFPYQLSTAMAVPSIIDLDRLSSRTGLTARMLGLSHSKWAEKMTSYWTIGTLAGPKFPVRNASEDLMVHLAIGDSPWGIVKGRFLSTKLRQTGVTGDLGFINKLLLNKNAKAYQLEMKEALKSGDVNAARRVMAHAVMEHGLPAKLDAEGTAILKEIAYYGNLDDTLSAVTEGSKNALRGGDQYLNVSNDVSKFGKMGALEIDDVLYKQSVGDKGFTEFAPGANKQNRISWLVSLGVTTNDDLAKIAVKHMGNSPEAERKALDAMEEYLGSLSKEELGRFTLYTRGETIQSHARRAYDATKNIYSKADGSINDDLLAKVRFTDEAGDVTVSTSNLRLEDLPSSLADTPRLIHGPTMVPVTEGENMAAGLVDKTWDYMGEANARFSREPIVIDAMIRIRKEMKSSGYDAHYTAMVTRGLTGDALKAAEENAKKSLVGIAEDLAKERVLAFVDNPAVRSQLAMSIRNFARFYRATEDFYRRMGRVVRYNPEAITRASLTYEGIAHSGFVQTDDNGDQYFFYPGLTPVYQVMNKVMKVFGVENAFQAPMPVEFGGKLKMITPSMNPDSLFPTFAGPLAAVPIKMIGNVIPQVADLEKYLTGAYGEDQPMISAVLPAHLNRLLQALNKDERSSQYASAARKAATYLEASGHGIQIKFDENGNEIRPSAGDIVEYQDKLQASTTTVLALRFLFGFVAPASPTVTLKSDMAKWVRDNERTSYKQVFNNLINQYNGDIDKASAEWIKLFPNQMPYTISESESTVVANVRAVDSATEWIKGNEELLKRYPEAAAFLIPQAGKFDFNAYKLLMSQGLKTNKTLTDFVRQVSSAKDIQTYYNKKEEYDAQLAATFSVDAKRMLRDQWETWSSQFKGARPLLQEQLGSGSQKGVARVGAIEDLRTMLKDPEVTTEPKTRKLLSQMLSAYDSYLANRDIADQPGMGYTQEYKDSLKLGAQTQIQALANGNENALAAYNSLFAPLFRD